jgi:hypothetical protein
LMEMRGVMFRALSRVNPLFIIYQVCYHSHTAERRGDYSHGPHPEQLRLNLASMVRVNPAAALLADIVLVRRADSKAQRMDHHCQRLLNCKAS